MNKLLKIILLWLMSICILYLGFSFVAIDFSFKNWSEPIRFFYVIISFVLLAVYLIWTDVD